eukprot:CAMPEP_0174262286 /NCGR_PEP_ID=MMETSP0439-20130205/12889_1 /TAXON_ID=0 /ORGANISM="Stereomyxa ramosa, Strain Chinc5" /LENGTH=219 /DNA_ID=CAMNT_0015346977 /DNA_START=71 /DNA_END=727 /DNA_ORIENTATION=-
MATLAPGVVRRVVQELRKLSTNELEGIKFIPNDDDITDIQAWIEGPRGTPYEGGLFRVRLKLGSEFPQVPPKGYFLTKIFHPNVAKNGAICVNTLKKDWKETLGVAHILLTIKCLLIAPNPESALNEEAGRLLLERYEDYAKHAALMTKIHAKKYRMEDLSSPDPTEETENEPNASNTSSPSSIPSISPAKKPPVSAPPRRKKKAVKRKAQKNKRSIKR